MAFYQNTPDLSNLVAVTFSSSDSLAPLLPEAYTSAPKQGGEGMAARILLAVAMVLAPATWPRPSRPRWHRPPGGRPTWPNVRRTGTPTLAPGIGSAQRLIARVCSGAGRCQPARPSVAETTSAPHRPGDHHQASGTGDRRLDSAGDGLEVWHSEPLGISAPRRGRCGCITRRKCRPWWPTWSIASSAARPGPDLLPAG